MKRAENGHDAFVDRLLSRPELSTEAAPYWAAFLYLERDRDEFSLSLGMGGGIVLVQRVKRPQVRAEGVRRGYTGDALDDFVEIVAAIDDERVRRINERSAQSAKSAAEKARQQKPRK